MNFRNVILLLIVLVAFLVIVLIGWYLGEHFGERAEMSVLVLIAVGLGTLWIKGRKGK